jgi:CheY-like chemotaxis protein
VIPERDVSVIFTPIFSVPVANFLNGVSDYFGHQSTPGFVFDFTAPGADILVVDDIETNLQVARGLLSPYGMRIKLCLSGKEAILAIAQRRYDLVFMDHMMPEMDGVETVSRIRAFAGDPYYKKLPIVALTANVVSEAIKMLLNSGFNDFLSKPIGVGELDAILKKWIPEEKQIKKTLENNAGQSAPPPDDHNMEIDGLDIDKGIIMTGGAVENYKRTLAVFTWDGLKKTDEIKKSLESDNLSLYTTHVHALKSAAANIGANELSNMAKELEMAGNQGDLQFIQAKNDALLSALELLIDKIRNTLKTDIFEKQIEPVDAALLQDGLIKLKTAIDDINPGQINAAVNFLKQFETEPGCRNKIGTIIQNTLVGEYDEALTAIHDLLQS